MAKLQPDYKKLKNQLEKVVEAIGGTITSEQKQAWTTRTYRRIWEDEETEKEMDEQFHIDWHTSYSDWRSIKNIEGRIRQGLQKLGLDNKDIRKKMLNRLIAGDEANIVIFNEINARTRELAQLHRMLDKMEEME
jgi:hypothetical protein